MTAILLFVLILAALTAVAVCVNRLALWWSRRKLPRFTAGENLRAGSLVCVRESDGMVYNAMDEFTRKRRAEMEKADPRYLHRKAIDDALFGGKLLP